MILFQKSIDLLFLLLLFIDLKKPEKSFLQLKEKKFYNFIIENQNTDWGIIIIIIIIIIIVVVVVVIVDVLPHYYSQYT